MSSIAGFIGNDSNTLKKMLDDMTHRGSYKKEIYENEFVTFGSGVNNIDGDVPIYYSKDKGLILIGDARLYNNKSLGIDIEKKSKTKITHPLEMVLMGYKVYGCDVFNKINGMFSLVIYDVNENKLVGARDIFGMKPLYYYLNDDFFFASEIKSFLSHPNFKKQINKDMIPACLTFEYVPNKETIFKNVFKLMPGTYFVYENKKLEINKYHEFSFDTDNTLSMEEWANNINNNFGEIIKDYKESSEEVGSLLSSGIDSSYVAYHLSRLQKVKTFSVGYKEKKYSELDDALEFAKEIKLEPYSKEISADECFNCINDVLYHMDEPLANPSAVALYYATKEVSKKVNVTLSGEGADELFGGYSAYQEVYAYRTYNKIPKIIRKSLAGLVKYFPNFKGKRFIVRGSKDLKDKYVRCNYVFSDNEIKDILIGDYEEYNSLSLTKHYFEEFICDDYIKTMQYVDYHTWLPDDILLKIDKMSSANSVEVRFPFLDKRMLNIMRRMPSIYKATKDEVKVTLRLSASKVIPEKTANRKKLGMPSPLALWMREEKYYKKIKKSFMSDSASLFFKQEKIMKLLDDHKEGITSNMQKIWSIYTFITWHELYFKEELS